MTKQIIIGIAVATLMSTAGLGLASEPTRSKIASSSIRENGCSQTSQTFKAIIPNPERLDRSYEGSLNGLEVIEREGNGRRSYGNFAFADAGTAVTYQLHAQGGGTRIQNPFGGSGNVCVGATGANLTIEIWAHYKPASN